MGCSIYHHQQKPVLRPLIPHTTPQRSISTIGADTRSIWASSRALGSGIVSSGGGGRWWSTGSTRPNARASCSLRRAAARCRRRASRRCSRTTAASGASTSRACAGRTCATRAPTPASTSESIWLTECIVEHEAKPYLTHNTTHPKHDRPSSIGWTCPCTSPRRSWRRRCSSC